MRQQFSTWQRLAAAMAVVLAIASGPTLAAEPALADRAPDRYTVQRGDTLWGIAGRFLRDPWRWPDIWRLNREDIKNPHRIYPGDVIVLDRTGPAPQLRLERSTVRVSPAIRSTPLAAEAIPSIPAGDIEPYLTKPLVTGPEGLVQSAEIIGGREARVVRGPDDVVYATGIERTAGDLWYIYRQGRVLTSPGSEEVLGYEQRFLGTARVERFGEVSTIRIASANEEILIGDRLIPAPREPLVNYAPHAPQVPVDGRIIATNQDSAEFGRGWVVTLDRGAQDGLDVGTVLAIYRVSAPIADPRPSQEPDRIRRLLEQTKFYQPDRFVQIPDERAGLLFVFRVFERVSYAIVLSTTNPVSVGDYVRQP